MRFELWSGEVEAAREGVGNGVLFPLYVLWKQHTGGVQQGTGEVASDVVVATFVVFVKAAFVQPTSAGGAVGPRQEARVMITSKVEAQCEPDLDHGADELEKVVGDHGPSF